MVNVIEKGVLLHYLVNPRLTRGGGEKKFLKLNPIYYKDEKVFSCSFCYAN